MTTHAKLSPSSAFRWLKCTAAPTLEAGYPDESSAYAEEGTFAHAVAETCAGYATGLITKRTYNTRLKKFSGDELYSQEMLGHCEDYAMHVKETLESAREVCEDAIVELEVRLDLTGVIPESFGTADCVVIAEPNLHVIDFKYGKGVKVDAEGNSQMRIYALGALGKYGALYDIDTVVTTIVQPRLGGLSTDTVSVEELTEWAANEVIPKAHEAFNGPGEFCPGEDTCRFCKAAKDCRARAEYYIELFEESPESSTLTPEEAGEILERAAGIDEWQKDLKEKVFEALRQGEPVTGWKLVEGKSNRVYKDEDAVAKILEHASGLTGDQIYTRKLITITQVEKLLGKKRTEELLGGLIVKPQGRPQLAPAADKSPEIHPDREVIDAFDEE